MVTTYLRRLTPRCRLRASVGPRACGRRGCRDRRPAPRGSSATRTCRARRRWIARICSVSSRSRRAPRRTSADPATRSTRCVETLQQPAHRAHRVGGLVRLHEPEERFEVDRSPWRTRPRLLTGSPAPPSAAGSRGAAASAPRARRWSGRPSRCPHHVAACLTQLRIVLAVGSNSLRQLLRASAPTRTSSTICRLNSGGYRTRLLCHRELLHLTTAQVSTKPGQLQYDVEAYGIPWTRK